MTNIICGSVLIVFNIFFMLRPIEHIIYETGVKNAKIRYKMDK